MEEIAGRNFMASLGCKCPDCRKKAFLPKGAGLVGGHPACCRGHHSGGLHQAPGAQCAQGTPSHAEIRVGGFLRTAG